MSSPVGEIDKAMQVQRRESVFRMLNEIAAAKGEVPNRAVDEAAFTLGVTRRTVRRWLSSGLPDTVHRSPWVPSDEAITRLVTEFRSVRAYRLALIAEDVDVPSLATMHRGFREHSPTILRAWAKGGFEKARGMLPVSTIPSVTINEEWAMDDTLLPIWCVLPDGSIAKPWMQTLIDTATRFVLTFTISPVAFTAEDAVETLASAVVGHYTEDEVFVGGMPAAVRTDRGSNFVAEATSLGLIAAGVDRRYSREYTPEQNGKIERWHRTIKDFFLGIPGYDRTHWKNGDPRKAALPPSRDHVLLYEEVVVEVQKRIRVYNFERTHSAHHMTPAAAWAAQAEATPSLIRQGDTASIRAAMRQTATRVLRRRRIEWEGRYYPLHALSVTEFSTGEVEPDVVQFRENRIDAMEGREVTVRFLHGRTEWISVYTPQGDYIGDAIREDLQTPEMADETAQARRKLKTTLRTSLDDIAVRDAAAVAARREEALAVAEEREQEETGVAATGEPGKPKKRRSKPSSRMEERRQASERQRRDDILAASTQWNVDETA